ncbi:unnamed protein product [[Actinomadura] parvosata subsp. kistnae]|uniref:Glycosyltransferase RgtA/B/C/D-like domain-containing protein n=1 Tax=[Actinomadura] parvosata subsp. kistnae TaxID=1909395 RepID=A0A1V0ABX4_9ACTN|nr:hypothetical protein [Nonomuraea sp. ATCC 55076]AQZ67714.1 hypothetical protein BKM31_45210 [Nonomuraea sp. ATCC 55076]SPL93993.1 unnamed protein product [Actinomadura parvosata subsp. kistnae]
MAHRALVIAMLPAIGLRVLAVLGFPPAILFYGDSFAFMKEELTPGTARPSGYSLLLALLRPAHSLTLVTVLQHLLMLGLAVALYALLRRRGLPGWGAALLVTPLLYDEFMILLEHMIMADAVFVVLVTAAVALIVWRVTPATAAVGGMLLGLAGITRTVGLPLLILTAAYLLIRRYGWRPLVALLVAGAIPLGAYATWMKVEKGKFGLTEADGNFLWSRTMSFADCAIIKPPERLAVLCPTMPVEQRPYPPHWLWESFSPLLKVPGTANRNQLAGEFARQAILAQPGAYLGSVATDLKQLLRWERTAADEKTPYKLPAAERPISASVRGVAEAYEGGPAATRVVEPFAGWLRAYQRFGYVPFPLLTLALVATLAAALVRRRWDALLPGLAALALIASPPFLAAFDVRYVIPAIPLICLAAGLTLTRTDRTAPAEPREAIKVA